MKTTAQKLHLNDSDFQMLIFGFYARWCESVAMNTKHFQSILANQSVNRWFLTELSKLETEFNERTDRYEGLSVEDYQRCYNDCTFKIFMLRPQPLLDAAKTPGSIALRSQGIPVFNHLNNN